MRANSESFSSRPVIVASSRQRRLWPLSTPERPFCVRPNQQGDTPLGRIIDALAATNQFAAPIIILSETAAREALPLIARHNAHAKILLVPAGTGSGSAAVLAALVENGEKRPLPLSLIPASFHAENLVQSFNALAAMATTSQADQLAIVMASRYPGFDLSFGLEMGERIPGKNLFTVRSFNADRSADESSAMSEMRSLVRGCGPAIVPPALLLDRLGTTYPTLISACRNALQLADSAGQATRLRGDFLRLVGRSGLVQLIAPNVNDLALYLASDDCRIVQTFRDPSIMQSNQHATLPVEVCGFKDARIIASTDGVLLLREGAEEQVKDHYQNQPETSETILAQTNTTRHFSWGSEEVLSHSDYAHIIKRTIQPKQDILFGINMPFRRTITVLSGALKLTYGTTVQCLSIGHQIIVPQRSSTILINESSLPAIFIDISTRAVANYVEQPTRLSA